jgi:hypothetical protein
MPRWAIAAFILFDVIVAVIVLRAIIAGRGGLSAVLGVNLENIMAVSNEMERETQEYLRANWSGDPTTLSVALTALLDRFEQRVREKQLPVTRSELKPMLGRLVLSQRLAKSGDVNEALKQVA